VLASAAPLPPSAAAAPIDLPTSSRLAGDAPGVLLDFTAAHVARSGGRPAVTTRAELEGRDDADLVRAAIAGRERAGDGESPALDVLFRRHHRRVAAWCLRWTGGRVEDAADLAQEVFLRAQQKLEGFRFESAFTTWLYLVTRTVALNRADAARRRPSQSLEEIAVDPADPAAPADEVAARAQQVERLRAAIDSQLEPLEAQVLRLHFVDGRSLPAIDRLLDLRNKSGAKAYLVAAQRKLRRHFGIERPRAAGSDAPSVPAAPAPEENA
jgi:RNA polymerase sigma-70 factor (ECF subfamily)